MKLPWSRWSVPARWLDWAIVAAWLVALEIENATIGLRGDWAALGGLLAAGLALAARCRRRAPRAFVAAVLSLSSALVAVWSVNGVATNASITPLYVLIFVPYAAARASSHPVAMTSLAAALVWGIGLGIWTGTTPTASYISIVAVPAAAWAVGRWLQARQVLNTELANTTEQIEAQRESRIRLAIADERTRVARELHQLVAGKLSAMVIQAEAAELLLEADAVAADRAMAAVEQSGRDALADMRRMLGVLRHTEALAPLTPQPGIGQLYALVDAARANGRSIELSVEGEPGPLPASVDLAVYRLVEEALETNGTGHTHIQLRFTDGGVELEITAPGSDIAPQWPTLAMRERAAICAGTVNSHALQHSRQLSVNLPRRFEEALA
ncbi:MAG: sensor histidine kinase [Polyangiaceae bacterium]